tara:strand:- start:43 stop:2067 length:2025 start_codon:yes stop_codon:yes gene_type:complete
MARQKDWQKFGFPSEVEWNKLDAQSKKIIKTNKALWSELGKVIDGTNKKIKLLGGMTETATKSFGEFRDVSKDIKKSFKDLLGDGGRFEAVSLGLNKSWTTYGKLLKSNTKDAKKKLKVIDDMAQTYQDVAANINAVGTEEFQNLSIAKQIRIAKQRGMQDEVEQLQILQKQQQQLQIIHKQAEAGAEAIVKPIQALDGMIKNLPGGEFLASTLGLGGIAKKMATEYKEGISIGAQGLMGGELFTKGGEVDERSVGSKAAKERAAQLPFTKKLGLQWGKLSTKGKVFAGAMGTTVLALGAMVKSSIDFAREMGISMSSAASMGPMIMFAKDEAKALVDEFGKADDINSTLLFKMKMMSFLSGVQASDQAKILMLQQSITGLTKGQGLDQQAKWIKEMKKEGLSASKVMGDMASHSEFMALHMKAGGKNIKDAAKFAAKLGLDLGVAESMANKLLDWESSIEAEMEASMLLGRQINLDKARQLAFTGDIEGMMRAVKDQVGGEAEFTRMNVVQRQSLADAIGLSGDKLAEFMKDQNSANEAQKSSLGTWMTWGAIILGIIGAIAGALIITGVGVGILGGMAMGAIAGGVIGAGIGAAAFGVGKAFESFDKPGTVTEGGLAKVDRGDVYTGEGGFDLTPMTNAQNETNSLMKGMMAQNQQLMRKLISTTEGVGTLT